MNTPKLRLPVNARQVTPSAAKTWDIVIAGHAKETGNAYNKSIETFIRHCDMKDRRIDTAESVQEFAIDFHADGFKASTLWTMVSPITKWLSITALNADGHAVDVDREAPRLKCLLKQWQKTEETKQSEVFFFFLHQIQHLNFL
jgi:hypothetical protein